MIAGLLGDRLGRKPVMFACVSAFGILSLVSAFVASPTQLAMVRVLTGLGLGGGIPLAIALAADFAPAIAKARFVRTKFRRVTFIGKCLSGLPSWASAGPEGRILKHIKLRVALPHWARSAFRREIIMHAMLREWTEFASANGRLCAISGHSTRAWRTGHVDP